MNRLKIALLTLTLFHALVFADSVKITTKGVSIDSAGTKVEVSAGNTSVETDEGTEVKEIKKEKTTKTVKTIKTKQTTKVDISKYEKSNAIVVDGNTETEIVNKYITADTAITVEGNGNVKIRNCYIVGKVTALEASGNANITIDNCIFEAPTALDVSGNGLLTISNSSIAGKVLNSGNGSIKNAGGNTYK